MHGKVEEVISTLVSVALSLFSSLFFQKGFFCKCQIKIIKEGYIIEVNALAFYKRFNI